MFVALALCQWAPWILAVLLPGPVAAVAGALLFAALVAWAVRRTPAADRRRWGLSARRPAGRLLLTGLATGAVAYFAVFGIRRIAGGLGLHAGWNLGAYLLKEGDPALVRLTADLPTGWGGWSDWVSVAGNAVLLVATLVLTRRRRASVGELSRMRQRS